MLKKAKGGAIELGNGLSQLKGNNRQVRMPTTGMKYSTYRLNPGSQLNRSIKLNARIPVPKFSVGGPMSGISNRINPALMRPQVGMPSVAAPVAQLNALRQRIPSPVGRSGSVAAFGGGGKVSVSMNALKAINEALEHLSNRDSSSAARSLRSSREAMANPDIAAVADSLRTPMAIPGASKGLNQVLETSANERGQFASGGAVCPHCGK